MFKAPSKVIAHRACVAMGSFIAPEYILSSNGDSVNVLNRRCPHRAYDIDEPGNVVDTITCKFHGFSFDNYGKPLNNSLKLPCRTADVGRSGLILKNFVEPKHRWVDDLAAEKDLVYSHSYTGSSKGSWLWLMEAEADLLHVRKEGIHPWLAEQVDPHDVKLEQKDNWIVQMHPTGWWLYIFPYTFVEWAKGMVSVNYTVPHDPNNEFGFDWITQFYFSPSVTTKQREYMDKVEDVFREDVAAIEKQRVPFIPMLKPIDPLEAQSAYFGNWVMNNRIEQ